MAITSLTRVASYYSATKDVGRAPAQRERTFGNGSYFSASADVGRSVKISIGDRVTESIYYERRNVPPVNQRGDTGSAITTGQTLENIDKTFVNNPVNLRLARGNDRALDNQLSFFDRLRSRLSILKTRLEQLQKSSSFNTSKAVSSDPALVDATTVGLGAKPAVYDVSVISLAVSHVVASDQQNDAFTALALSGTVSVNGYSFTVSSTDTLTNIMDLINKGEDKNGDGILQTQSEDLNGNGKLDVFHTSAVYIGGAYLPGITVVEDRNHDGILDGSEDVNGNKVIDGGSKSIEAKAYIEGGRLYIKSLKGGDSRLKLNDNNNVLESLGFYKRLSNNSKVLRDSGDYSYNQEPSLSSFKVNTKDYSTNSNSVSSVIKGVELSLKGTTDKSIKIEIVKNTKEAEKNIIEFANSFNNIMQLIDQENINNSPIKNNVRVQDLTIALVKSASAPVFSAGAFPSSLSDIGIRPADSLPTGIDPSALNSFETRTKAGSLDKMGLDKSSGARSNTSLFDKLDSLGISTLADFTLTLNKLKLRSVLTQDSESVYNLFNNGANAVANRLALSVNKGIEEPNGTIAMQQSVLLSLKKNKNRTESLLKSAYGAVKNDLAINKANGIIDPVKKLQNGGNFFTVAG